MLFTHVRAAVIALLLLSLATWLAPPAAAAVTDAQRQLAAGIDKQLDEVKKLYRARKYEEAGQIATRAQVAVVQLRGDGKDKDVEALVRPLISGLNLYRRLLARRKVTIPDLPPPAKTTKTKTPPPADAVSFKDGITPILTGKCGRCHINNTSGGFSMATFNDLMRGAKGVAVISPGSGKNSRIVEVLVEGDMPRGGGRMTPQEIAMISKWIDQGARFDGESRTARLMAPRPANVPRLKVVEATGKETTKFSRDIAPVLVGQCVDCHGGNRPQARLGMDTFQRLLAGTRNGPILTPGKPAESLIIKKLKGTAEGARMPARRPPLKDDVIAKFEKWIAEGAKFDGPSPTMPTEQVAKIYAVTQMSHEDLAKERLAMASKNWRTALPDQKPDQVGTENFLLMGNVSEDRLNEIGKIAEQMQSRVGAMLGAPSGKPLVKGRLTIYVFNRRFQYSEFGRMVERLVPPKNWRGHSKFTIIDAYACIYPPQTEEDGGLEGMVAEQLAEVYLESLGKMPKWFSQGSSWVIASRINAKDPRVAGWNDRVLEIAKTMSKPSDLFDGELTAENRAVMNYSFAKYLMGRGGNYRSLLSNLGKGGDFEKAFIAAFRGDPKAVTNLWGRTVGRRR